MPDPAHRAFLRPAHGGPVRSLPGDPLDLAPPAEGWLWLDLVAPGRDEVQRLASRFGWDRLTTEDVLDDRPLAKFADHGEHIFVVLHGLGPHEGRVETVELDAFLSERMLVTIRHGSLPALDELVEASTHLAGLTEGGPDRMLARVAAALTGPFLPLVDALEERIEHLEDLALDGDPAVVGEVQALRRDATRLRRFIAPHRDVMMSLSREGATPLVTRRARQRFADVHEQVYRTVEAFDAARFLLASVLETYRSAVSEDMNRVMKVLTVFSALMLPLTLMAGIWGMNFVFMPELDERWGYPVALGSMALVGVLLWSWFARRGFIGGPRLRDLPAAMGMGILQVAARPARGLGAMVRALSPEPGHPSGRDHLDPGDPVPPHGRHP